MSSSCIFPSAFFPVSAFSSTFCISSFSSEALGFSAGNIRVVTVTALRFSTLFFQFTLGTFSISVFSLLCLLCLVVFGFVGQVCLRLGVIIGFDGFFGGFLLCFGCA